MRVVLDTNIILSALLFRQGRVVWIRQAWQVGVIVPVICKATTTEILRVLPYPKFKLVQAEQDELLADFLPWAETFMLGDWPTDLPECRDSKDVVFLALAKAAEVDALVTGDADLLALRRLFLPAIITADELKARLGWNA